MFNHVWLQIFFLNSTLNCPKLLLSDGPHTGSWRVKKNFKSPGLLEEKKPQEMQETQTDCERRGQAGKGGSPYCPVVIQLYICIHSSLHAFPL